MVINTKNYAARDKSLKITVIYFVSGCAWIFLSDRFVQLSFSNSSLVLVYSIAKGFLYVLVTSILIYGLTYSTLKEVLEGKEALKKANSELEKSNKLYRELIQDYNEEQALMNSLIDTIPDLIFYKDTNGGYLGCNAAFELFAGKPEQDIIGHTDKDLFTIEENGLFSNMDQEMINGDRFKKNEGRVTYPDGKEVVLETVKTPYHDHEGNIIGLIGISRDITERKRREEKIQYISYHDTMTEIYNRTYFDEARITLDSPEQLPLSVIVGDVNGMKLINDAFGRAKGDKLLQEIAKTLKKSIREGDIVARTGGDEFSILMPRADGQAVNEVVDRIRALCKSKRQEEHNEIFFDIALGYATKSEPSESLDKTMMLAEDVMYRRKLLVQKSLRSDYLSYIKTTMFEKSNETEEHSERLAELAKKLGVAMGLSENKLDELELVAMLHDIGKISVDKNILTKKGKLSDAEWREIKKHPEVGYRIRTQPHCRVYPLPP